VRSTVEVGLDALELPHVPTASDAPRAEGILSLVVRSSHRLRGLPVFYLDNLPLIGDNDLSAIVGRIPAIAARIVSAESEPTYLAYECEYRGHRGLYVRDTYTRSAFRLRLRRAGLTVSDDPFVVLGSDGFAGADGESFRPAFLIIGAEEGDEETVVTGAILPFSLVALRLGKIAPSELRTLTQVLSGVPAVGAPAVAGVIGALDRVLFEGPSA
jgi:hypothetical protein